MTRHTSNGKRIYYWALKNYYRYLKACNCLGAREKSATIVVYGRVPKINSSKIVYFKLNI